MIRKVSIIGAATLDGLCSVAAGDGFIPVCIWQVWMRMGGGQAFSASSGKSVGVLRRLVYSYNVPDFTSESVKLERRKVERGIVSRKRVPVKVR